MSHDREKNYWVLFRAVFKASRIAIGPELKSIFAWLFLFALYPKVYRKRLCRYVPLSKNYDFVDEGK